MSARLAGPILSAEDLCKQYGHGAGLVRAVDGVSISISRGESIAIVGPSGCGKSTLLYLLGGMERSTGGAVWLAGQQLGRLSERDLAILRRQALGFVFQAFHLLEELSALENVELPLLVAGVSPREARRRAHELLERVGLADRGAHLPSALSGGESQRAAIARALGNEPAVVLADEPTGNLDTASGAEILRLFGELHVAGQTLVVVTHDERIAATCDRVVFMRDGRFVEETTLAGRAGPELGAIPGWGL